MTLVENVILGLYIGVLTGIFAAIIIYVLTVLFTYVAGAKLPVNMALMIGLGVAGLAGGPRLLLRNPEILQSTTAVVMLLVILLISLYVHQKGQELGKALPPKQVVMSKLRTKTFSPGVVKQIGRFGEVEIRPAGDVSDIEGYPPLPEGMRRAIRAGRWTFPADLPIPEIETRLEEKLRKEHHLADAVVTIDADGGAAISAAPPSGGLSRRVPTGKQVVTLETALPAGIAAGDTVRMAMEGSTLESQVISARVDGESGEEARASTDDPPVEQDGDSPGPAAVESSRRGGNGRVALAVDPDDVRTVHRSDPDRLYVRSRGRNREHELVSLLRRNGNRFRRLTLRPDGKYLDRTLGELDLRSVHGVVVLALKRADEWRFAPDYTTTLRVDDELFVTGPTDGLDALQEGVA